MTVQMGGLYLGPVKIFSFPEVQWQTTDSLESTPNGAPQPPAP
jgi:hypothetical protein